MLNVNTIVITITIIFLIAWVYRYMVRPSIERNKILKKYYTPHIRECHQLFNELYRYENPAAVARAAKKAIGRDDFALIYGEIDFVSYVTLLQLVEPKADDNYYDLGCGGGKAVFASALTYQLNKCVGIELLTPLYNLCTRQLNHFEQLINDNAYFTDHSYQIEFINNDLLAIDISDADIVFINATGFFGELWDNIVNKLIQLKPGCRIIITTKKLPLTEFELIEESMRLMSWGMNSLRIYRKI